MEKILSSQNQKFSNVLSAESLMILSDLELYKQKVEKEQQQILKDTEAYCKEQKQLKEQEAKERLEQLSQQLYEYNKKQLILLLKKFDNELYPIIYRVLHKLGITDIQHNQISNLLVNEMNKFLDDQELIIRCNQNTIDNAKHNLEHLNLPLTYNVDDKLTDGQCVIETNLCLIYVDIHKCAQKIMEILKVETTET